MPGKSECVYLVFDRAYQLVGLDKLEQQALRLVPEAGGRIVGPVEVGKPIDWDNVKEEVYGPFRMGGIGEYVSMVDGVPLPPELFRNPFTREEVMAMPGGAAGAFNNHVGG